MPRPDRRFFQTDAATLARRLLGQRLVRVRDGQRLAGLIVETEAYLGVQDKAAHTYAGRRTPRNETMWGEAGHGYVYFTYGMHHCMNVVAAGPGDPQAVLLRALEPVEGIEQMHTRRPAARRDTDLCSGPGKLCAALGITRADDGVDLVTSDAVFIEQTRSRALPSHNILATPRIGIGYAQEWIDRPLRFVVRGNAHVSGVKARSGAG